MPEISSEILFAEFMQTMRTAMMYPEFRAVMAYGLIDMLEKRRPSNEGGLRQGLALGLFGETIGFELKPAIKSNLIAQGTIAPVISSVAEMGELLKAIAPQGVITPQPIIPRRRKRKKK